MTTKEKIAIAKNRLSKMKESIKNSKCPGASRALEREIRNMERQDG